MRASLYALVCFQHGLANINLCPLSYSHNNEPDILRNNLLNCKKQFIDYYHRLLIKFALAVRTSGWEHCRERCVASMQFQSKLEKFINTILCAFRDKSGFDIEWKWIFGSKIERIILFETGLCSTCSPAHWPALLSHNFLFRAT